MAKPALSSDGTERLGVNIVERIVLRELGWLFREQSVSDYGIDAIVEARDSGQPTGRLLALQIKSGRHTMRRRRNGGWAYSVKVKHERYWRHHALPVLLVLVDVEEKTAWWEHVTSSTLRSTGKNFSVLVPQAQLVAQAGERWRHLASARYSEAQVRYPNILGELPPGTGRRLRILGEQYVGDAAVFAAQLADARSEANGTAGGVTAVVSALLEAPPPYLDSALAWQVLGVFAAEHALREQSAVALERAAALDPGARARLLASAALHLTGVDGARAEQLCTAALALDAGEPRALVARVALAHGVDPGPVDVPADVDLGTERALADPSVQELLAVVAQRRGDHHLAVDHRQRALAFAPEDTGYQVDLGAALLRRSQSQEAQLSDLARAVALVEDAVAQLHRWGGPTEEPLDQLLTALALDYDWSGVLRWALPAPAGAATPGEAARPHVLRLAFAAANNVGDDALVRQLAQQLGTSGPDGLRRAAAMGEDVSAQDVERVWTEELQAAATAGDDQALVVAAFHLAEAGLDESSRLEEAVLRGAVPEEVQDLVAVVALAAGDLEAALPAFRELADRDATAAEHLVVALADARRTDEAVAAAAKAQARLRQPSLGLLAVDTLNSAGRKEDAVSAAAAALATGEYSGLGAAQLHDLVGTFEAGRGDWVAAERHFARAVEVLSPARPWRVWKLMQAQVRQHEPRRAAATLRSHPVDVLDAASAGVWLEAHLAEEWDDQLASTALALAERFLDDVRLVEALLNHVVLATQATPLAEQISNAEHDGEQEDVGQLDGEDRRLFVPAELHERAFKLIQRHVDRHRERSGFRMLSGTPEALSQQVREIARRRYEASREVDEEAVRRGRLPLGFVAAAAGRSTAFAVVARAAGVHMAVSDVEEEHDAEVEAAATALAGAVVVDASSLYLTQLLPAQTRLAGHFTELRTPEATRQDILRALAEARQTRADGGTMGWDSAREGLTLSRNDPADVERLIAQCEGLVRAAEATTSVAMPQLDVLNLDEAAVRRRWEAANAPWLAPVQLARDEQRSLWSDDLVIRGLAREVGVAAFSTVALLEALCRRAIEAVPEDESVGGRLDAALVRYRDDVRALAAERVVDLPLYLDDLLALGESDGWQLGAVAVALMRPSMWQPPGETLRSVDEILRRVAAMRPDQYEAWGRSAMTGAATGVLCEVEGRALVIATIAELGGDDSLYVVGSGVAREHGLPDPAPMAARAQRLVNVLRTGPS